MSIADHTGWSMILSVSEGALLVFGSCVGENECLERMEVGRVASRGKESARDALRRIKVREKSR